MTLNQVRIWFSFWSCRISSGEGSLSIAEVIGIAAPVSNNESKKHASLTCRRGPSNREQALDSRETGDGVPPSAIRSGGSGTTTSGRTATT